MRLTIINGDGGDDTVVLEGVSLHFSLSTLMDARIWAVQWYGSEGEIEYRDGEHARIESLDQFEPVIAKYHQEKALADEAQAERDAYLNSKGYAMAEIDRAAGAARDRFVSPGELMAEEYNRALTASQHYQAAGFSGQVPLAVQTHADVYGVSEQQAAEAILSTAAMWLSVIDKVRDIRLKGKAAIEVMADGDDFLTEAHPYIDALNALQPE